VTREKQQYDGHVISRDTGLQRTVIGYFQDHCFCVHLLNSFLALCENCLVNHVNYGITMNVFWLGATPCWMAD
jgi:hypothetical protein